MRTLRFQRQLERLSREQLLVLVRVEHATVGQQLRRTRRLLGLTQAALVKAVEAAQASISQWERRRTRMPYDACRKVACALAGHLDRPDLSRLMEEWIRIGDVEFWTRLDSIP